MSGTKRDILVKGCDWEGGLGYLISLALGT